MKKTPTIVVESKKTVIISENELSIVQKLSNGLGIKEVAAEMKISSRTIEAKIGRLKQKVDCNSIAHLCCFFLRKKIIE